MKILNNVYIKNTSVLSLDTTNTISPANAGEMAWNQADGTLDLKLYNGTTLQQGQEVHVYAKASGAIANGDVVQFAGAQGDHILIKKAVGSEIKAHPEYIVGISTHSISNGNFGYITHFGKVHELDTEDYAPGTVLYFDCATSALITTVPVAPNPTIIMAAVLRQHQNEGSILVRPRWSSSLSTLNDVNISNIQDGQVIAWNAANLRWENSSVSVAAEDVSIIDSGAYFTSDEVEGALQEAGNLLDNALYGSDPVTGDPIPVDADTLDGHDSSYFATQSGLEAKAPINNPTFTGTVVLPSTTSIGTVSNTEIAYLDGVTSAIQTQLNAKAPLASPTFTGTPLSTTAAAGTNTTQIATTAFVQTAVSNLVDSSPTTLDTLNELAAALGDDPNFATTVATAIGNKLDSSSYTASDILTKIKTVDGAGSGLDADTLDGYDSTYFAPLNNPVFTGNVRLPSTILIGGYDLTPTAQELNYVDGVTSSIQTQLNNKSDITHTHDDRYYTESEIDTLLSGLSSAAEDITLSDIEDYYISTNVEGALVEVGYALSNLSAAASDITIADSGSYFTSTDVEGALQEVAAPKGIQLYDQVISVNFTIPGNKNALSVGPITIDDGVTVTIEDGATWAIV